MYIIININKFNVDSVQEHLESMFLCIERLKVCETFLTCNLYLELWEHCIQDPDYTKYF